MSFKRLGVIVSVSRKQVMKRSLIVRYSSSNKTMNNVTIRNLIKNTSNNSGNFCLIRIKLLPSQCMFHRSFSSSNNPGQNGYSSSSNSNDKHDTTNSGSIKDIDPIPIPPFDHTTATNDIKTPEMEDRYYYLVKQKFSPTRHQKFRPSKQDGLLQKNVSNKPFRARVFQSYTDAVSYFMPKGYPESVGKGYRNFATGQMASMVSGTYLHCCGCNVCFCVCVNV